MQRVWSSKSNILKLHALKIWNKELNFLEGFGDTSNQNYGAVPFCNCNFSILVYNLLGLTEMAKAAKIQNKHYGHEFCE